MLRTMCKSKIHRATVTGADLNYIGSITIDRDLIEAAELLEYEQVHVVNITNGARFETYVIPGEAGGGEICLNGAAARLAQPGDKVIIISYGQYEDAELREYEPRFIFVDEQNRVSDLSKQSSQTDGDMFGPIRGVDELTVSTTTA